MHHTPRSTRRFIRAALAALVGAIAPFAAAQGTLTPPGAPAPTMKSLEQLDAAIAAATSRTERRTPVSAATTPGNAATTFIISQPGSYYLTQNLVGEAGKIGINVTASGVTLDLNGFALQGGASGQPAVLFNAGLRQFAVRNGTISGGWSNGVRTLGNSVTVTDLAIMNTTDDAIRLSGIGTSVSRCHLTLITGGGIVGTTDQCLVSDCTVSSASRAVVGSLYGILASQVENCVVSGVTNTDTSASSIAFGVNASVVRGVRVTNISASALTILIGGGTVQDCSVINSGVAPAGTLYGIQAREVSHCHVSNILAVSDGAFITGIYSPQVSDCLVERVTNTGTSTVAGIRGAATALVTPSSTDGGMITRCTVTGSSGSGIVVSGGAVVEGNRVGNCTNTGISATHGVIRGNYTNGNATGISLGTGLATGNTSNADTTAFIFAGTVRSGPIVVGGGAGVFDPNANIDL